MTKTWQAEQARLEAAYVPAQPEDEMVFKPMFGGACVYSRGRIFASLSDVGLALKLSPSDQDLLLAIAGAKRLQYEADAPPSKQYIVVPDAMAETQLLPWIEKSLAFVKSGPAPKSRGK